MKIFIISITIYIIIGIIIWIAGFIKAPSLWQDIAEFLYIVFLWPVILFNFLLGQ